MYIDDDTRLRHMHDAAREALSFLAGRSRPDLDNDRMLYRAVVSCLGEIGEAASKLTPGAWASLPSVPWQQIVGMRNRLVHGYYEIDRDIVWDTVSVHLPPLIAAIEELLARQTDEEC